MFSTKYIKYFYSLFWVQVYYHDHFLAFFIHFLKGFTRIRRCHFILINTVFAGLNFVRSFVNAPRPQFLTGSTPYLTFSLTSVIIIIFLHFYQIPRGRAWVLRYPILSLILFFSSSNFLISFVIVLSLVFLVLPFHFF